MGNQTCCFKPDEKFMEVRGGQLHGEMIDVDKDGYPHDSQQGYREESNIQGEIQNSNQIQISNQQIYNQDVQQAKLGNAYEVPIDTKSPNENDNENDNENENDNDNENDIDNEPKDQNEENNQIMQSQNSGEADNMKESPIKSRAEPTSMSPNPQKEVNSPKQE